MPLRTDPRTGIRVDLPADVKDDVPREKRTHFYIRGLTCWGVDFVRDIFAGTGAADQIMRGEEAEIALGHQAIMALLSRAKLFEILKQGLVGWGNFFESKESEDAPDREHKFETETHAVLGQVPTDATLALLPLNEAAWLAAQVIGRAYLGPEAERG